MDMNNIEKLERRIRIKINKISNQELSPKDSEIGKDLNLLKRLDEPSYDNLLEKYKIVLNN